MLVYLAWAVLQAKSVRRKAGSFRKALLYSIFATPLVAAVIFRQGNLDVYHVSRYKCPNCDFRFDKEEEFCPLCEKEGKQFKLEKVRHIMT